MVELERRRTERMKTLPGEILLEYRQVYRWPFFRKRYRPFGVVVDLSIEGLAVEYTEREMRPMHNLEYALVAPSAGIRLEGVPLFAVSDYIATDIAECSVCRRRGLRFGVLGSHQHQQVRRILQVHARNRACR